MSDTRSATEQEKADGIAYFVRGNPRRGFLRYEETWIPVFEEDDEGSDGE